MDRTVEVEVSDETLAVLRRTPEEYAADLRIAAAAKMYELGMVSQEIAAQIAGLSREELMIELGRFQVSPFQETPASLEEQLARE